MASPESESPSSLSCVLVVLFYIAMIMGTGPGTLLVNRAVTIEGIPLLYLWGILWYAVFVVIALVAYFCIWKDESDKPETGDSQ